MISTALSSEKWKNGKMEKWKNATASMRVRAQAPGACIGWASDVVCVETRATRWMQKEWIHFD
jgi:hypothetical protein